MKKPRAPGARSPSWTARAGRALAAATPRFEIFYFSLRFFENYGEFSLRTRRSKSGKQSFEIIFLKYI